jgi:hypothetical protein
LLLLAEQSSRRLPTGTVPNHFFYLRDYSSLFNCVPTTTTAAVALYQLPSDAFLAPLVHTSFCYVVRSSPMGALLSAAGDGAIRSLRRSVAATVTEFAFEVV